MEPGRSGQLRFRSDKPDLLPLLPGSSANIALFHQCITTSQFANNTVSPSVRSNLASILARIAAVNQGDVTWAQMMRAAEKLESDIVKHLKV